jgi:mRNA-decapping enzyme 1B
VNSSAHVAFYTFNTEENEWEKTDIEGALFIYARSAEPYYSIFINNRLNTNSLVEPITAQIELQSQPPFLLYRNERSRIRGFWFYNQSECDRIGNIIGRLIKESSNNNIVNNNNVICEKPEAMKNKANKSQNNGIDIFTMLTKAQEEFNNSNNQVRHSEQTNNKTYEQFI